MVRYRAKFTQRLSAPGRHDLIGAVKSASSRWQNLVLASATRICRSSLTRTCPLERWTRLGGVVARSLFGTRIVGNDTAALGPVGRPDNRDDNLVSVRKDPSTGQIGSPLLMTQPTASLVISG
jgi:hypothetical protein